MNFNSIYKVASYFENILNDVQRTSDAGKARILKKAEYPTADRVKSVVKQTVDNLISVNKNEMQGVLSASNVQLQINIEDMFVSFLVNTDDNPKLQNILTINKPTRDKLINDAVLKTLQLNFKEYSFRIHFSDFPTKNPGWFGSTPD